LAPLAVVNVSVSALKHTGTVFEKATDDLGEYKVAYYSIRDQIVALMHHKGEPKNRLSVYLDRGLQPEDAQDVVNEFMADLGIDINLVEWRETGHLRPHAA
jgi:hypothetical protein